MIIVFLNKILLTKFIRFKKKKQQLLKEPQSSRRLLWNGNDKLLKGEIVTFSFVICLSKTTTNLNKNAFKKVTEIAMDNSHFFSRKFLLCSAEIIQSMHTLHHLHHSSLHVLFLKNRSSLETYIHLEISKKDLRHTSSIKIFY